MRDALASGRCGLKAGDRVKITMRSSLSTELDEGGASSMIKLLEMLEDLDDVQNVFSNAEIPDEILASSSVAARVKGLRPGQGARH